ncbi:MAG: ABC transporter permease [Cytophagales bacterium]
MNQFFIIAKKEFLAKVKAKSFWWIAISGPVFLVLMAVVPIGLSLKQKKYLSVLVLNQCERFENALLELPLENAKRYQQLRTHEENAVAMFLSGDADALVIIPDSLMENELTKIKLFSRFFMSPSVKNEIVNDLKLAILLDFDSSLTTLNTKLKSEYLEVVNLEPENNNSDVRFVLGLFFSILVYLFILSHGVSVIRSLQEEKSSRLFEVVLVNTNGWKLMLGKIAGIFAMGVFQAMIWLSLSLILVFWLYQRFELSRFNDANFQQTIELIQDKDQALEMNQIVSAVESMFMSNGSVYVFILMMIFGFLLYSSVFIYMGLKSTQNDDLQKVVMLISVPLVVSILSLQFVYAYPQHWFSQLLLFMPFSSPIVTVFAHTAGLLSFMNGLISFLLLLNCSLFGIFWVGKSFKQSMFNFKS